MVVIYRTTLLSPLGELTVSSDGTAITGLWFTGQKYYPESLEAEYYPDLPVFQHTIVWLDAYFTGRPLPVLPPLAPSGSPFRQAVWTLLQKISLGQTTTYGALSRELRNSGLSAAPQAVGSAVGHNPISILIPCHRVLGADGSLTGYAGGIERKRFLLHLEAERFINE